MAAGGEAPNANMVRIDTELSGMRANVTNGALRIVEFRRVMNVDQAGTSERMRKCPCVQPFRNIRTPRSYRS